MKELITITAVRRDVREINEYLLHIKNIGIINSLDESEQRRFRGILQTSDELNRSDWTTNYY